MIDTVDDLFPASKFARPDLSPAAAHWEAARAIGPALDRARLVSVVAPAGSGKSTLLAAWAADPGPWCPVWVRLDDHDDDPTTLARALAAAVRTATGTGPGRLERLLSTEVSMAPEHLATALVNDLDDQGPMAVVLDDLHHLEATDSRHLVEHVADGLGPRTRLLVAGRVEPHLSLPRRRVRQEVVEIGGADLRLGVEEIDALLGPDRRHDPERVRRLLARSGGWAAAVVLLVADPAAGTADDAGPVRGDDAVDEFLRSEVLAGLPPDLVRFALVTSLLPEADPEACRALTGDEDADDRIAQLRRRGLLERHGTTFRYLDRIAEFLRRELTRWVEGHELTRLRRRAADLVPTGPGLDLLLAAGDGEAAAGLVVEAGRAAIDEPGDRLPRHWLRAVADLDLDPTTRTGAWLALLLGLTALEDGDVPAALDRLDGVPAAMRALDDHLGELRSAYALAEAHLACGQVDAGARLLDELLEIARAPDERVRVLMAAAWLAYFGPDWSGVGAVLDEAFALALGPGRALGRRGLALGLGTEFLFVPQGPQWLLDRVDELGRRDLDDVMAATALEVIRAAAHLVLGHLEQADELIGRIDEQALELGELTWLALMADRVRLAQALLLGDHPTVDRIVDAARGALDRSQRHHQERGMYAYALARSGHQRHRPDLVRAAALLVGPATGHDRPDTAATAAVIRALDLRTNGRLEDAADLLVAARRPLPEVRFCLVTGVVDLELAGVRLAQGRQDEAVALARPALSTLATAGLTGVLAHEGSGTHDAVVAACVAAGGAAEGERLDSFARNAADLHHGRAPRPGLAVPDTGERLTGREIEVLDLVEAGLSNRAVADRLFIGERTVKSHMTAIMRKLAVTNRTAAVARARSLRSAAG